MRRLALMMVSAVAFLGCKSDNSLSCKQPENQNIAECMDAGSGNASCTGNEDCTQSAAGKICDTGKKTCVECMANNQCPFTAPRCDTMAETCGACVDDNDCKDAGGTPGVCLPSGACAATTAILHVKSPGSTANDCGATATPCSLDKALSLVVAGHNVIRIDDAATYTTSSNFVIDTDPSIDLTIDAGMAKFAKGKDGLPIFTINSNKALTLLGGTIDGAKGGSGILCNNSANLVLHNSTIINNDETGVSGTGCTAMISRAVIMNNSKAGGPGATTFFAGIFASGGSLTVVDSLIAGNRGGGVTVANGQFVIIGDILLNNGDAKSLTGGLMIGSTAAGNRLEFNTLINNRTDNGIVPGIQCTSSGFIARNNIIWNNMSDGAQIGGNCSHAYSAIGPQASVVPGTGNTNIDPALAADGHLTAGSASVLRKADPAADLTGFAARDIDDDLRVAPADIGADQASR